MYHLIPLEIGNALSGLFSCIWIFCHYSLRLSFKPNCQKHNFYFSESYCIPETSLLPVNSIIGLGWGFFFGTTALKFQLAFARDGDPA